MDERVHVLVDTYTAGRLSRRTFLREAAQIVGAGTAAYLLVACASGQPDNLAASPPRQAGPAPRPAAGAPAVETRMIAYPVDGAAAPGYLAAPVLDRAVPGVVLIQEWWGIDEHIKDVAGRLAAEGFVVVAPDLYRGEVAREPSDARRLAMGLVQEVALADIQGAADYLSSLPSVEPKQVGVVGFCMGGGLALMAAYRGRGFGASVVFYGGGVRPTPAELQAVSAPILGLYGEADASIPVAQVRELERKLGELGKASEFKIYPGASHAFFNDTRPSYNPEAAADAWERTLAWLRQHLAAA